MYKFLAFLLIIIIAPIIGGLYGIIHDQFTYTISNEYFTKFKFYQFELMETGNEAIFPNPRLQVAIIGWNATWWMGIPIGLILGFEGFGNINAKSMLKITIKSLFLNVFVVFIVGLIGLAYGYFILSKQPMSNFESWYIPSNVIDPRTFINVSAMHNFSYIGGIIGLIIAITYSTILRKRSINEHQQVKRISQSKNILLDK
jgi:hypothetical protein